MKRLITSSTLLTCILCLFFSLPSSAFSQDKPAPWEVYVFPRGGCTDVIIRELSQAKNSILLQAYSFTSAPIAKTLLNAHKKGAKVEVILDKNQRTRQSFALLEFIPNEGIAVC